MAQTMSDKPPSLESRIEAMRPHLLKVLSLIASGAANDAIAERLDVTKKSLDNYINVVYGELGITGDGNLNGRVQAALLYLGRFPENKEKYQREFFEDLEIQPLTPRQHEIYSLMAQGYSNDYIAEKLYLTKRGVENRVNAIYEKLNIHSYEGTIPRVMAMLMFDRVSKPEGYKPEEPQLAQLVGK